MPVDRRSVEAFFKRKLIGSERCERAKHVSYRIVAPGGRIILGNLTFSRMAGGEDLTLRNLKGLAADVGLSVEGFIEAASCKIRPSIVVLCAAIRAVDHAYQMYALDPVAYDRNFVGDLRGAVGEWLRLTPEPSKSKLTKLETKELQRSLGRTALMRGSGAFAGLVSDLEAFAQAQKLPILTP